MTLVFSVDILVLFSRPRKAEEEPCTCHSCPCETAAWGGFGGQSVGGGRCESCLSVLEGGEVVTLGLCADKGHKWWSKLCSFVQIPLRGSAAEF